MIPDDTPDGQPKDGFTFRSHFLDLRTLAFSLTDRGYSLESACEAFGVEHGKQRATTHMVRMSASAGVLSFEFEI